MVGSRSSLKEHRNLLKRWKLMHSQSTPTASNWPRDKRGNEFWMSIMLYLVEKKMPTDFGPSGATKTTLTVWPEAPIEFRHQLCVGFQDCKSVQNESNHILAALLCSPCALVWPLPSTNPVPLLWNKLSSRQYSCWLLWAEIAHFLKNEWFFNFLFLSLLELDKQPG